eukprot:4816149-Amphidinium_carterae.1
MPNQVLRTTQRAGMQQHRHMLMLLSIKGVQHWLHILSSSLLDTAASRSSPTPPSIRACGARCHKLPCPVRWSMPVAICLRETL